MIENAHDFLTKNFDLARAAYSFDPVAQEAFEKLAAEEWPQRFAGAPAGTALRLLRSTWITLTDMLAPFEEVRQATLLLVMERGRQIEEKGYNRDHDDQHTKGELAIAAACYAVPEEERVYEILYNQPTYWPFGEDNWKPTPEDRIRELSKAGALILAELERLLRCK